MNASRIFVVEDEFIVSAEIEERLMAMGYRMAGSADTGEMALERISQIRPDLILMDIRLQGEMDGITAAVEIRRRFLLPVIFLTAYSEDATLEKAKLAEPYGYILKPFDDRELKSAIEIGLYKHRSESEIHRLNRLYDTLSQVNQSIVRTKSREELLQNVCRIMVDHGDIDLAWIDRVDTEICKIQPEACHAKQKGVIDTGLFYADRSLEIEESHTKAILENRPFICNESLDGRCGRLAVPLKESLDIRSCGAFPIHFQDRLWGVLNLGIEKTGFFQEREIDLLKEVVMDVSFALDKLESDAQRWQTEKRIRRMSQIQSDLHAPGSLSEKLKRITDGIVDIFSADFSRIWLMQPGDLCERGCVHADINQGVHACHHREQCLHLMASSGRYTHLDSRDHGRVPFGCYKIGRIASGKESSFLTNNVTQDPRVHNHEWAKALGLVSFAGYQLRPSDGNTIGVLALFSKQPLSSEEDALLRSFGNLVVPMIQTAHAEESLKENETQLRLALDAAQMGAWDLDLVSKKLIWSELNEALLGFAPGAFPGTADAFISCVHPEDLPAMQQINTTSKRNRTPFRYEYRIVWPDGSIHWMASHGHFVFNTTGQAIRMMGVMFDISERREAVSTRERLEGQLRQAQKMEAVGTLAGGIAHDFNNILSPIIGYTEMLMDEIPESSTSRFGLEQVLAASNRAKDLVNQILSFSRMGEEKLLRPIDIGTICKEAMKLLRASLPSTIEIQQKIASGTVLGDATQIHQIIVNLCTNAFHAIGDKGKIEVSLSRVHLTGDDLEKRLLLALTPGPYLKLSVSDSGAGMDPATLHRIFEPYFTTKEAGKGTGLGLAVVHGIVQRHGGEITVQSRPGAGSVFDVYLPEATKKPKDPIVPSQSLPTGSERILVVDDEAVIVQMTAKMLEQQGYEVTAHTNSEEALRCFLDDPQSFDMIITDFTMPRLTGIDLAREIFKVRPGIPLILCTGYHENAMEAEARKLGISELVMKPLDRRQLIVMVRKILDGGM